MKKVFNGPYLDFMTSAKELHELHEKKHCYLDAKLSNVLISAEDKALLCDFGSLDRTGAATDMSVIHFIFIYAKGNFLLVLIKKMLY